MFITLSHKRTAGISVRAGFFFQDTITPIAQMLNNYWMGKLGIGNVSSQKMGTPVFLRQIGQQTHLTYTCAIEFFHKVKPSLAKHCYYSVGWKTVLHNIFLETGPSRYCIFLWHMPKRLRCLVSEWKSGIPHLSPSSVAGHIPWRASSRSLCNHYGQRARSKKHSNLYRFRKRSQPIQFAQSNRLSNTHSQGTSQYNTKRQDWLQSETICWTQEPDFWCSIKTQSLLFKATGSIDHPQCVPSLTFQAGRRNQVLFLHHLKLLLHSHKLSLLSMSLFFLLCFFHPKYQIQECTTRSCNTPRLEICVRGMNTPSLKGQTKSLTTHQNNIEAEENN